MAYDNHMARRAGLRLASRFSPLLPGVAQGLRIVVPTCAAARRPAAPRRVRGEPAPTHHSRLPVAIQLSGGKVRLVGTRVAPDDARDSPQVGQPPLPGGCTVARRRVVTAAPQPPNSFEINPDTARQPTGGSCTAPSSLQKDSRPGIPRRARAPRAASEGLP